MSTRVVAGAVVAACLLALTGCSQAAHRSGASATSRAGGTASSSQAPARPARFGPRRADARGVSWQLPDPIAREAVITDRTHPSSLVVAGGMLPNGSSTAHAYRLSLATGRARHLPELQVPVHDAAGGLYAGKPAVFGGGNGAEQSLVQQLTSAGWHGVDQFPTTRSDLSVVSPAGATLVIGGYDGSRVPLPVLRQSGNGRLRAFGSLRVGVRYAATATLGRFVYVIGGEVDHRELDVVQRISSVSGRTIVVGHLPRALGHAQAVAFGGRILIMGGRTDPDTQTDAMWWLDLARRPAAVHLTPAGRLPAPLSDAAVVATGHHVWLIGGEDPGVTDRVVRVTLS